MPSFPRPLGLRVRPPLLLPLLRLTDIVLSALDSVRAFQLGLGHTPYSLPPSVPPCVGHRGGRRRATRGVSAVLQVGTPRVPASFGRAAGVQAVFGVAPCIVGRAVGSRCVPFPSARRVAAVGRPVSGRAPRSAVWSGCSDVAQRDGNSLRGSRASLLSLSGLVRISKNHVPRVPSSTSTSRKYTGVAAESALKTED